jgi:hypothetical protein
MTSNERLRTLEDLIYLVAQMVHAERRIDLVPHIVFYYERWSPPNAVRLTSDEERFFGDAMLEAFLLSHRNLLDFFDRPERDGKNPRRDSRADVDFGFKGALVADAHIEFERVSKHLAHLSEVRKTRTVNEMWSLTSTLIACRQTLKDFFAHCLTHYSETSGVLRSQIDQMIDALDFLGTTEHFICHKHASRSPFMSHDAAFRISIPPPTNT